MPKTIRALKDIPFGYMITVNNCKECAILEECTYEHLALCFYLKNEKDRIKQEPEEE